MVEKQTVFQCGECMKSFLAMEVFVRHPCVTGAAAENINTSGQLDNQKEIPEKQQEEMTWTTTATKLMLCEFKKRQVKIDEGKLKKKKAFEEISEVLKQKMYPFSGEQCATRLKTITRAYKQTKDHNNKSGNERKNYVYEKELDEMFGDKPNVSPVCVVSSQEDAEEAEESTSQTDIEADPSEQDSLKTGKKRKESSSPEEEGTKQKSRKNHKMSEVLEYLETQSRAAEARRKEEEEKKEKRHNDRMQLFKEFINVLKDK